MAGILRTNPQISVKTVLLHVGNPVLPTADIYLVNFAAGSCPVSVAGSDLARRIEERHLGLLGSITPQTKCTLRYNFQNKDWLGRDGQPERIVSFVRFTERMIADLVITAAMLAPEPTLSP